MRAAAVQLNATDDKQRNLATAERLVRAAAARRRAARRAAREVELSSARPRTSPPRAEPLDGPTITLGARDRARAADRPASPARSSSASRASEKSRTRPCTSVPTARSAPSTARSTCSTSRSAGTVYRESGHRGSGRRDRRLGAADGVAPGHDRLLRPALPRALPDARASRGARIIAVPVRVHAGHDARPLGDPAARAGDREPGLRRRRQPGRRARARPCAPAGAR